MATDGNDLLYPGTLAYKNIYGEKNPELLSALESKIVILKSFDLDEATEHKGLGIERLQAIHKHLFGNLYDWAGELRENTAVKFSNEKKFTDPSELSEKVKETQKFLEDSGIIDPDYKMFKDEFASKAAELYGKLNENHMFVEGNGRASSEYIRVLAEENGISFKLTEDYSEEWHRASKKAFEGNIAPLKILFKKLFDYPENGVQNKLEKNALKESVDFVSLFDKKLASDFESKLSKNNDVEGFMNKKGISKERPKNNAFDNNLEP